MNVRTYRAYSMADALTAVKRDLGPDAVILNTRSTKRGGFLGIGRATIVEVVAMPAAEAAKVRSKQRRPANSAPAMKAYAGADQRRGADPAQPNVTETDRQRTREFAQQMLQRLEQQKAADNEQTQRPVSAPQSQPQPQPQPPTARPLTAEPQAYIKDAQGGAPSPAPAPQTAESASNRNGPASPKSEPMTVARRFVLQQSDAADQQPADNPAVAHVEVKPQSQPSPERSAPDAASSASNAMHAMQTGRQFEQMQNELSAIRQMVGHVLQRSQMTTVAAGTSGDGASGGGGGGMPKELFDYYLQLVAQDLSDELADQIVNAARDELKSIDMADTDQLRDAILEQLADYIPCAEEPLPLDSPDDRPLTIALVGPTGVGKTTTLAKLAASFKLRHDRKVGLVTCDTYRIAAVDQLRTYANIIGLSLEVVLTPAEMQCALDRMQGCDVILIDTAGRSQRDAQRIDELRQFMDAAQPHEVHLVLSSTASEKVLLQEAEAFSSVGVDKLVFTKLDEAVSFGMLINVTRQLGKQLSFFTTGQEVPDHIEIGRPSRLAELVLGGAVHA